MCRCRMIIMGMRRIGEEGGDKEYLGLGEGLGFTRERIIGIDWTEYSKGPFLIHHLGNVEEMRGYYPDCLFGNYGSVI